MRENNYISVVCVIILIKIDKVFNLKMFFRKQMYILQMIYVLYKERWGCNGNLRICVEFISVSRI